LFPVIIITPRRGSRIMEETELKREIGLFHAVIVGLNGAIGIGIFLLLDYATLLAGQAVVVSLLLCGLLTFFTMLSYCELGTMLPEIGGEYTFTRIAFGGVLAFVTGWLVLISNVLNGALGSIGFAYFLSNFVKVDVHLTALLIVFLVTVISLRGMKFAEAMMVYVFIAIFTVFILAGFLHGLRCDPLSNVFPHGLGGVVSAMVFTYNMFFGLKAIIASAPQIKNPEKTIPRAIFLTTGILTAMYSLIAYVAVGVSGELYVVPGTLLTNSATILLGEAGRVMIAVAGIFASLMTLSTAISVQASVITALSRDGYLPDSFMSVHKRFGTHYKSILFGSVMTAVFASTGMVEVIGYAASFAALLVFILVNLSLIKLRMDKPFLKRPFKIFLYPFTPVLGIIVAFILLLIVERFSAAVGLSLVAVGLIIYYVRMIGYRRFRIAIGGANVGIGLLTLLIRHFFEERITAVFTSQELALWFLNGLTAVALLCVLTGLLNVLSKE